MVNDNDWDFFDQNGYVLIKGILQGDYLKKIQNAYDEIWEKEGPRVNQHKLLKNPTFIELIEHPPLLDQHRAIFGSQTQLLQYDLLRQDPDSKKPDRGWHRDFSFPGDYPLSVNTIIYLDHMTDERGPTYVIPGSHCGWRQVTERTRSKAMPDEVAIYAEPGDAAFINAAVWHSGGANRSDGFRRTIFPYYGHWWLKRYEWEHSLPWQCLKNASEQRLRLLGVLQPEDLHMYGVDALRNKGFGK